MRVVAISWIDVTDITYTIVPVSIWTLIEQNLGIVCACLPTMRPLFGRLLHEIKHSSRRDSDTQKRVHTNVIPLPQYVSRNAAAGSAIAARDGFARLSEENMIEMGSVTAYASKAENGSLPAVPDGILKQQRVEQHVEKTTRS